MMARNDMSNNMPGMMQQQQQQLMLQQQQQQFMIRQHIIQQEQLQKQRALRQQEMLNQQSGLNAAISELQQKTRIRNPHPQMQLPNPNQPWHPQHERMQNPKQMGLGHQGLLKPASVNPLMMRPPGFSSSNVTGNSGLIGSTVRAGIPVDTQMPQGISQGHVIRQPRLPGHLLNSMDRQIGPSYLSNQTIRPNMSSFSDNSGAQSTCGPMMPPSVSNFHASHQSRERPSPVQERGAEPTPCLGSNVSQGSAGSCDRNKTSDERDKVLRSHRSSSYSDFSSSHRRQEREGRSRCEHRGKRGDDRSRTDSASRTVDRARSESQRKSDRGERNRNDRSNLETVGTSRSGGEKFDRAYSSSRSTSPSRYRDRDRGRRSSSWVGSSVEGSDRSRDRGLSLHREHTRQGPTSRSPSQSRRSRGSRPRSSYEATRSSDVDHRDVKNVDLKPPATENQDRLYDSSSQAKSASIPADGNRLTATGDNGIKEMETVTYFTRSCPADLYFMKETETGNTLASSRMIEIENRFEEEVIDRAKRVREFQIVIEEPPPHPSTKPHHHHHHCTGHKSSSSSSSSESSDDDDDDDDDDEGANQIMEEWEKRKKHPYSLHPELWFNIKGQANDGPLCRCSIKSRKSGIRHDIYPKEEPVELCDPKSNNLSRLHHYRVTLSPSTNLLTRVPTLIQYDDHEYIFEGFSLFSHSPLDHIPPCKLLRFNIEYTIHFLPESAPENFTVRSLNLFNQFLFTEILELIDLNWAGPGGGCPRFHLLPRFSRTLPDSGCKEVLSMNTVLSFLLRSARPLVEDERLDEIMRCDDTEWRTLVDDVRGMIVTNPGLRPSSLRIDQLDRKVTTLSFDKEFKDEKNDDKKLESMAEGGLSRHPLIIHQGYRPAQLSYAGDPAYRKAWKQYVKFRHLLNSKPKILAEDKQRLKEQEERLQEIRMKKTMKREVTVELSSKNFLCTGLRADVCQHALMMPVLMSHLRFHTCLDALEEMLDYKFIDRTMLQLSLTHTSYRTNYGTNPDHTRNSLTNCGMRQVEYGDRRVHYQNTRKRGICILVDIMSRMGKQEETMSEIPHNERLEFLGDAVIEFLTSVHLFYMFPWLEEGGLTTYRMALVQNQHLALLAKKLKLQDFMLYVHGPDLCHESDLRHAMANCCEALMGALYLDGGIHVVDRIFSSALFDDEGTLLQTWNDIPQHVLQQEEPGGDRHWVKSSPILQKLEKFEEMIGVKFTHIRLLAKAFTHRNIGVNPLTLGHNQRLEFLGDTVLQLVASEYLYKHYPEHHEGHLSLLRSSLVNSRTQGLVYDDLGMSEYVIFNENAISDGLDMKTKQRADILESFVGALFVDKDLDYCRTFCDVCFFPRLKDFILNQDWNDPKSQLQQCCLTLREVGGGEPDIPIYKVIESIGPTNTRKYVVAVYFRGSRLATGNGHSIQQAEMEAATNALKKRAELFPILQHQRRFLERMRKGGHGEDVSAAKKAKKMRPNQRRRKGQKKNSS